MVKGELALVLLAACEICRSTHATDTQDPDEARRQVEAAGWRWEALAYKSYKPVTRLICPECVQVGVNARKLHEEMQAKRRALEEA
jgi:hypothetical protein